MKRFLVSRTVHLKQAIMLKAKNGSEAKELARKSKFKDWSSLDNKKRTDYTVTEQA